MPTICPQCFKPTLSKFLFLRSLVGAGNPACSTCHTQLTVRNGWKSLFGIILIFTFMLAVAFSIKEQSYLPYFAIPLVLFITASGILRYAKWHPIKPMPRWLFVLHIIIVLLLILWLNFLKV